MRTHACWLLQVRHSKPTYDKQQDIHVVRVDHMSSSTWQGVLQFVYKGEVCISPGSSVASLVKAANTLQIPALQTALLAKPTLDAQVGVKTANTLQIPALQTALLAKPTLDAQVGVKTANTLQIPALQTALLAKPTLDAQVGVKTANPLQIPALQTALLAKPTLDAQVGEKQVIGEIALVEPCSVAVSLLNEEHRSDETMPSVTGHGKVAVRRVTVEETVAKCEQTSQQKPPIRCKESVDAVNESTTDNDNKAEPKSDDNTSETEGANEVDTPGAPFAAKPTYLCKLCGRALTTNGSLKRHMLVHNDKPYRCDTCHLECTSLYALRKHSRTHAGEKPHVRGKSFSTIASLSDHTKIHTGVPPHVCDLCDDRFHSRSAWKMHRCSDTSKTHMKIDTGAKHATYVMTDSVRWVHGRCTDELTPAIQKLRPVAPSGHIFVTCADECYRPAAA